MNKNKHLSIDDREIIEDGLKNGMSFTQIGKLLNKDRTTVAKEVRKNRTRKVSKDPLRKPCKNVGPCTVSGLCPDVNCQRKLCKTCGQCTSICRDFSPVVCDLLDKPPYVCNGCSRKLHCHMHTKYFYRSRDALEAYISRQSLSREGINMTPEEFKHLDDLLTSLVINNSQSLYHIYASHEDEIPVSLRTLYTYTEKGYFSFRNIDLPRKVSYKPRKKKKEKRINKTRLRENRTYEDYQEYIRSHEDDHVIEMDTVEGIKGESLILTLHAVKEHFQIFHLMPNKESRNIRPIFESYRDSMGTELFTSFFKVILTDNGTEFSDILFLEEMDIHVFFCDPCRSDQKGACEKNHEFIRYFIPKGESLQWMTMDDVQLMASHINSVKRSSLNKKSPYEAIEHFWGRVLLDCLKVEYIEPDKVIMNRSLFNKK